MNKHMDDLLSTLSNNISTEELLFTNYASELAVTIAEERIESGMTQKEFAEKMGKTQAIISKWENGETNFTLKTLIEIAQKLGLELDVSLKPRHIASASPKVISFSKAYISPTVQYTANAVIKEM